MGKIVRIAAVGDLHCTRKSQGAFRPIFREVSAKADVLLLCGDLTDYGLPEEAHILADELNSGLTIPAVAVLGNHDYESNHQESVRQILLDAGVTVLDGDACDVNDIAFVGAKGFAGGFDDRMLGAWGEGILKKFVHETMEEALKLETGLKRAHAKVTIVLLHYAPIRATVIGEAPEIFAFLGSTRLEEPLNRFPIAAVFHGHAHSGSHEGQTKNGVPVFNVALPLLRRISNGKKNFKLFEVEIQEEETRLSEKEHEEEMNLYESDTSLLGLS